jgi:RNA polymerase sigma-70 factor (ECF subfamily)
LDKFQEAKLIARVVMDGHHPAFAALVKQHQSQIRNYARRLTNGDQQLADDIAQETFITAFEKIRHYSGQGSFIGWLLKITYRHFLQQQRKKQPCYTESTPARAVESNIEEGIMLEQALKLISHEERSAITLNATFGHSHAEIAEIMLLPLGTVKSHIVRGKNKLAEFLNASSQGVA